MDSNYGGLRVKGGLGFYRKFSQSILSWVLTAKPLTTLNPLTRLPKPAFFSKPEPALEFFPRRRSGEPIYTPAGPQGDLAAPDASVPGTGPGARHGLPVAAGAHRWNAPLYPLNRRARSLARGFSALIAQLST